MGKYHLENRWIMEEEIIKIILITLVLILVLVKEISNSYLIDTQRQIDKVKI